ncbi:hypothetical protein LSG31_00510 [Fodinisporobacter ferrooxydans]|uniref:Uncharacterized protein n=1 Tax=Fodinisporobacter ferrooxydans TaxID=2901836 RepID=A0ABY4CK16_9BACL|nr:hypothetical protein LSG31_00510 [Alicyclobacillaceae bacterium MYW30-H2]
MSKIQDMINETQTQVEQTRQQLNQFIQQKQQIDQAIEQGKYQYNSLYTRLSTLQEMAGIGQDLFHDQDVSSPTNDQTDEQTSNQDVSAEQETVEVKPS